jgi:sterol desaturase/sphingolipid hydroxylase (fatty acid hydroxylase superfamily)
MTLLDSALDAATNLVVLAAVFVPLERVFPARPTQRVWRPELAIDACFFVGQYLVWSALAAVLLGGTRELVARHGDGALMARLGALPIAVKIAIAIVGGDFIVYWFHRACHAWEPLWRFHAVHHSAEHLDWLAAHREHPVDGILTQVCVNLPGFLVGLPLELLAGYAVFRGMWAIFVHSNVRVPLGPLRVLLGAPELHHWHHARLATTQHNFANLAPWMDLLFGTYHRPEGSEAYALGLTDPWPRGYVAQLARPFRLTSSHAPTPPPRKA